MLFYASSFSILTFNHYRWKVFCSVGCEALGRWDWHEEAGRGCSECWDSWSLLGSMYGLILYQYIYGFSIKVLLISNFLMWILIHFLCYSKIGCSRLWDKEAPDHAYHRGWPCICGWPNWGASYCRTLQWVYPKLWHCCLQQDLRNILLVQRSSHFRSAIYFFCR